MRHFLILLSFLALMILIMFNPQVDAKEKHPELTLIIEVEGDIANKLADIKRHHPRIEVLTVYDTLLNGLAVRGKRLHVEKLLEESFVENIHPVTTYKHMMKKEDMFAKFKALESNDSFVFPHRFNNTVYTGKGVKVAVIDTGIDYTHPDLQTNYEGGKDVVDFDDDPMETTEEGATIHGTHVAGIIGANGNLQGVAPDVDLYGYRALGPGGSGTSIQVIAAMEEALKDHVDIINLSLGNSVNGPDYPTSLAVNQAIDKGVSVVIANGNSGPNLWTIGAPATATKALAVGALSNNQKQIYFNEPLTNTKINTQTLPGSSPWTSEGQSLAVVSKNNPEVKDRFILVENEEDIEVQLDAFEKRGTKGIILYGELSELVKKRLDEKQERKIPVFILDEEENQDFINLVLQKKKVYVDEKVSELPNQPAPFSSRGPVSNNWAIKPDILAPGVNIVSTVPGGYEPLNGTSMATPHIAGGLALMKEAHPNWTVRQLFGALRTTALRLGANISPLEQGMGMAEIQKAIDTKVILHDPLLTFGQTNKILDKRVTSLEIENMTSETQTYDLRLPPKKKGFIWDVPKSFTLGPYEKKKVTISLAYQYSFLEQGIEEGWITLERDKEETYYLPYVILNEVDFPRMSGFSFHLEPFKGPDYEYELYVAEDVVSVDIHLYNPETLIKEATLLQNLPVKEGYNTGEVPRKDIPKSGFYLVEVTAKLTDGSYQSIQLPLSITN